MRISFLQRCLGVVVLLGAASIAQAELIVGTETEGNGGFGLGFSFDPEVNLVLGQAFTLSQPVVADSITVYLNGDESNQFTLQVMDQIGGSATPANVLLTRTGNFPDAPSQITGHGPVTFSSLGLPLGVGTYYLVLSSDGGPDTGWGSGASSLPGGVGTVGSAYVGIAIGGGVGDYTLLQDPTEPENNLNFRIDAVPEPNSALLLLLGSVMLVGAKQAKRRWFA